MESASYSEEDLLQVYEDVLALPASMPKRPEATDPQVQAEEDAALLPGIASRWFENCDAITSSSSDPGAALRIIVSRLQEVVGGLEQFSDAVPPPQIEGAEMDDTVLSVPTGLLTKEEWLALVRTSVRYLNPYLSYHFLTIRNSSGPFRVRLPRFHYV